MSYQPLRGLRDARIEDVANLVLGHFDELHEFEHALAATALGTVRTETRGETCLGDQLLGLLQRETSLVDPEVRLHAPHRKHRTDCRTGLTRCQEGALDRWNPGERTGERNPLLGHTQERRKERLLAIGDATLGIPLDETTALDERFPEVVPGDRDLTSHGISRDLHLGKLLVGHRLGRLLTLDLVVQLLEDVILAEAVHDQRAQAP